MDSQKIENLLNLSLNSTMEEREKSLMLNVGYDEIDRTWELIVKYHGDLEKIASETIQVEVLTAGYAIVTLPESLIQAFTALDEVEYIEKPKRLYFSVNNGRAASCISPVTNSAPFLSGSGTIVAVIDSGIDYTNMDFRNNDGTTRIFSLWDQSLVPDVERGWAPPRGFSMGVEFGKEQIDEALRQPTLQETYQLIPSRDSSGHGTAVTGIAAGNGTMSGGLYRGVAPVSNLIIVKLGRPVQDFFPRTTELMRALVYVTRKSIEFNMPVAINLSFGNTYGAHDGTSLLERYIDNISEIGKNVICVGSGNEGNVSGHASGVLEERQTIELAIANYELALSVQLWKNYNDDFSITVVAPNGESYFLPINRSGTHRAVLNNTQLLLYVGEPAPYSVRQEIFIDFIPQDTYIGGGVWGFIMEPIKIITGDYNLYLPSQSARNVTTGFYAPSAETTLTIPSTASKVVTVGAYNANLQAYADFSGRGYVLINERNGTRRITDVKPDIVAPGVNIITTSANGGYDLVTGTSFATPFVTGSASLMMEWGIVQNNDAYLYGEKVKAYLIKGARQIPGFRQWPNAQMGWGTLCVRDSLPL